MEALVKFKKLKKAAEKLCVSYSVAKQRLYRVRLNYRETSLFLQEWERKGYDAIFARFPSCSNCQFTDARIEKCTKEEIIIASDEEAMPCGFWKPKKEMVEKQRRLERQIKKIRTVEQIHIVENLIKECLFSGALTEPQYEILCGKLSEQASKVGERKSELKLGPLGTIGWEKKGTIT